MEENNILLQESQMDGSYQLRLKLKYLQQDKEKLQVSNKEMKVNIELLRQINRQLAKSTNQSDKAVLIGKVQQQNRHLELSYIRIMQQNKGLTCRNLMLQQIIQESQNQQIQILKGYQNKIIQLRRSIQFKESCIQSYEQNAHSNANGYEVGMISPSNISMVFFNQIDSYKNTIALLQSKLKQLQAQLAALKDKHAEVLDEKTLIDSLVSSRHGYTQFRQRLNYDFNQYQIRAFSSEKPQHFTKNTQLTNKQHLTKNTQLTNKSHLTKNNQLTNKLTNKISQQSSNHQSNSTLHSSQPQQTRQISYQSTSGNFKLNQLKDQLKKTHADLAKLTFNYRKQLKKRQQNDHKIQILLNSNKFYKSKRQSNVDQLNYFKRTTADLLRLIQKRKLKRTYSVDKTQVQQIIASIKKPREIQLIQNNKKYWKNVQEKLKIKMETKTKVDLQTINRTRHKKSFSDVLDFSKMCHDDDNIEKYYLQKSKPIQSNKHSQNAIKEFDNEKKHNLDDFSRILELGPNGQIFDDQTLIIKAKPISYAERKKAKTKTKISDVHNLTIIRQNIL